MLIFYFLLDIFFIYLFLYLNNDTFINVFRHF